MHVFFSSQEDIPKIILPLLFDNCGKVFVSRHLDKVIPLEIKQKANVIKFENVKEKVDAFVFDVTKIEPEVIYQIASAIETKTPVIILCNSVNKYPPIVSKWQKVKNGGRVIFMEYDSRNVRRVVKKTLQQVKQLAHKRIGVSLPSRLYEYLVWKQKETGVSKATFVQKVLEDKMKKDQRYKVNAKKRV